MYRILAILLLVAGICFVPAQTHAQASCTSPVSTMSDVELQAFTLINQFRVDNHLAPLAFSPALQRAAVSHSVLMASTGVFAHDSLFATMARFQACGEQSSNGIIGENIAGGNPDAAATVKQWLDSPEHRANILTSGFTDTGISRVLGTFSSGGNTFNDFPMWTQEFSSGAGSPVPVPVPVPTPVPTPVPVPVPVPVPTPVPPPVPVPIPIPAPPPVPVPIPVPPVVTPPLFCLAPAYYRTGAPTECPPGAQIR